MDYGSIWAYFVGMALLMLLASAPMFKIADFPASRISSVDGLRGFLAFAVFFHHAVMYHTYVSLGAWRDPPHFYQMLGELGVCLFFIITGYLFWGKILRENGKPNWFKLYGGRLFRIAPAYFVAVSIMLVLVACRTGFVLNVSVRDLFIEIIKWLAIGVNGGGPNVNGYADTSLLTFGVTWTLSSEWKFYISLLVLAFAARRSRLHLPLVLIGLSLTLTYAFFRPDPTQAALSVRASLFLFGMLAASLESRKLTVSLPQPVLSVLVTVILGALLWIFPTAYAGLPVLFLGIVFLLIISGGSMFGLLSSRPARRVGDVSYSIYLMQGLIVNLLFTLPSVRSFSMQSPADYWVTMFGCTAVLLLTSTMTYVFVERTGINVGKRFLDAVHSRWSKRYEIKSLPASEGIIDGAVL